MTELSDALKTYYKLKGKGVRQLATDWQTSPATASRFINGQSVEVATFLRILAVLLADTPTKREDGDDA